MGGRKLPSHIDKASRRYHRAGATAQPVIKTFTHGPDGLHRLRLRSCAVAIAEPLSHIYNRSFEAGLVPSDWIVADIVPIFTKRAKDDPTNYRALSVTSVPCKVMESLVIISW